MLIQRASDILSSEITPERGYNNRREFIRSAATLLANSNRHAATRRGSFFILLALGATPAGLKAKRVGLMTQTHAQRFRKLTAARGKDFYEAGLDASSFCVHVLGLHSPAFLSAGTLVK